MRPTLKIGLIAPFEGLHRRSGYAALEAARAAIADSPYPAAGILPLALDDGGGPQGARRAAQKLLVDDRVAAVVGPLSPEPADAAQGVLADSGLRWFPPYALPGEQWAEGLAAAAGALAAEEGAAGLALAGWTPGWPQLDPAAWSQIAGLPVRLLDDPAAVRADEAVFWLGSSEGGAAYLIELRRVQPQALFVLGPAGEDPVFAERVLAAQAGGDACAPAAIGAQASSPACLLQQVYWTAWVDAGYTGWTARHHTDSPGAYLVYRATLAALAAATGATGVSSDAPPASWKVQAFQFDAAGDWSPVPD